MSFSAGSASSGGAGQFGARPKIGRQVAEPASGISGRASQQQQQSALGSNKHHEWNANWNSILSAQVRDAFSFSNKSFSSIYRPHCNRNRPISIPLSHSLSLSSLLYLRCDVIIRFCPCLYESEPRPFLFPSSIHHNSKERESES